MINFIYNFLRKYGDYKKHEIKKMVSNNMKKTIENLAKKQREYGIVQNLYSNKNTKNRANRIYNIIKKYIDIEIDSLLDFGGGSCDISYYLGYLFKANNIYCVDIDQWLDVNFNRNKNVIFMNDTKKIKDKSINFILASYVLHHINDNEIKKIIDEFKRILTKDGLIILIEHDSPDKNFNKLLDIQHILYDTVISQISDYDTFIKNFYSNYKRRKDWDKLFSDFIIIKSIKFKKYDRSYICIYKNK
jgi:ubiquinone/menaquinone biosynthesis C-methylase UbiE